MNNKVLNELFEDKNIEMLFDNKLGILFEIYSTGMALGYARPNAKGVLYPRKDRINKTIENAEISTCDHGGHRYLNESQLYDFMLEAHTEKCRMFRKWITNELLPKLRKNGYYIDENIKPEQIEKLEQEVKRLKDKLLYERTRKGLGALDIVKFVNINDLLPSSLFVFMSEYLKLGTYIKVNKNRRFKPNDNFIEKCSKHGVAIIGTGNIIFYESFAEAINKNPKVLEILKRINENEIQIREQGIKNKNEKSE